MLALFTSSRASSLARARSAARDQNAMAPSCPKPLARTGRSRGSAANAARVARRLRRAQQQLLLEMPLAGPEGGLWLLDRDLLPDPLYGEGFVLRRAEAEWCLSDDQDASPSPQTQRPRAAMAALPPAPSPSPRKLLPYQRECLALVSVPVSDDEAAQLGIVPWQDPQAQPPDDDDEAAMRAFLFGENNDNDETTSSSSASWDPSKAALDAPTESASPRRTSRVRFTCRRCGATTQRPVNPHAWRRGTVFATCGGCGVTHKLVDNLRLFHELDGPVFGGGAGADAGGAPPAIAWQQQQQQEEQEQGPEAAGSDGDGHDQPPPLIISTDFRAGRWAADGELGLPLGLRWLIEEQDEQEGGGGGGGPGQA
jgi:hypothetical protein